MLKLDQIRMRLLQHVFSKISVKPENGIYNKSLLKYGLKSLCKTIWALQIKGYKSKLSMKYMFCELKKDRPVKTAMRFRLLS